MILISQDHISKSQGRTGYFCLGVKEHCKNTVYKSMISACAEPIILFCDKFGKEKLRDEASSREAQQLEGHIGLGLRKSQMSKQCGPNESTEEADWWRKQRKERRCMAGSC